MSALVQPGNVNSISKAAPATKLKPYSSPDSSLSAFAQLGALRLEVQRSTISLFGRYEEHILTKATRTLSLRDDSDHNIQDKLWVGTYIISYERSLCAAIVSITSSSTNTLPYSVIIIPDLIQSELYENHPDITGYPNFRFIASAPIVSPKGIVIGAYIILDDKPRHSIGHDYQKFLINMAATVGAENDGRDIAPVDGVEGYINTQQQDKQHSEEMASVKTQRDRYSNLPFRLDQSHASPGLRANDS
ncbi:hypothetical protein N7466_002996 [Penicillium verhagenii]|uniref:uncharacterized protein n=1 Tax=Penicillium verhagenii TaxID=1562060 RepID=UPI0025459280|nr:uncharacterized protein N7466_002996 [Penicillium verhagenii]KAJ5936546.1 hypothetical protein N7466_002996 [Penicillium verhagenii]